MNLTDERAIYVKLGYASAERHRGQWRYFSTETHRWRCCPPLDMNTAFSECIPKLLAEGLRVELECCLERSLWVLLQPEHIATDGDSITVWHPKWHGADFYAALLQYLGVA